MTTELFSDRSLWTMAHGLVLGGGALLTLAAALFALHTLRTPDGSTVLDRQARDVSRMLMAAAALLWLTVVIGTYVTFPPYRATPPEGATDLSPYPRALVLSSSATAWLHTFAMETKEHVPWIAAMLTTAAVAIARGYRSHTLTNGPLNRIVILLVAIAFALVSYVSVLGVFVNKAAPLQ